ncbi:LemA family protein [Sphingomonas sp. AX6]|uniref:LemA family protein n=1 Tax=Sphingomonas sp. AX6 TaxID=2653171 RepID=UPI0012EF4CA3|nr:LemA family protein [Sphingomonas sp. AX6]VXC71543.1 LemA protein [Sphingomonas sp. AX6]
MSIRLAFIGLMALSLSACGINSVPTAEENAKAKWADVQAAYQRRADLIPNLQATVQGAAGSERQILTEVIDARSRATAIQITGDDLTDPAKVQQFQAAQSQLGGTLSRLMATVEAYPQLQSQQGFQTFMTQIEGTENRINITLRDYNEAVRSYNTTIRTFPDAIGAKVIHGAEPMVPFEAQAGANQAPTVDFGNSN